MNTSPLSHLRDILILPFTVTCVVPYFIYQGEGGYFDESVTQAAGIVLLLLGFALFVWCVVLFDRVGKGTLAPWSKKHNLIVQGPYRYARNPMITGVLLIVIGEGLFIPSLRIMNWAGTFFLINTVYFLIFEEPQLRETFGKSYEEYCKHVPRWFFRITPYKPMTSNPNE